MGLVDVKYTPNNCPGYGDTVTWGPFDGHPNDPRYMDDEDAEFYRDVDRLMAARARQMERLWDVWPGVQRIP